jgi:hypothetical protein
MLALDGGGIRGLLTLQVLAQIEHTLRHRLDAGEDFVLADYFDYVAGTSSGAIIAAGLALGLPVDEMRELYLTRGADMFDKAFITKRSRYKYDSRRLQSMLQDVYGADTTLGDDRLRTLLMMVLRNATTDSAWPLSNNPRALYNSPNRPDNNLRLPLWQLVRASTAAPTYFPPEVVTLGERDYIFIDGGITMYNNPAFQLFLMATLEPYGLQWQTGEDKMLIVSVGSGTNPRANDYLHPDEMNLLFSAHSVPAALMYAASTEQDLLCRVFGRARHAPPGDRELGAFVDGGGLLENRLFSYVRYNVELNQAGIAALGLPDVRPEHVQLMDSIEHVGDLERVGMRAARQVRTEHFDGFLAAD